MTEDECLSKMIPPGAIKKDKYGRGVIQILVTTSCNLSCYNCTQGSNLRSKPYSMTLENFEKAVLSVQKFHGVIGIFGGCPTISKNFHDYCDILSKHIPYERRGLWANNLMGKGEICRKTFNPKVSNLNVHLDKEAYNEIRKDWPEAQPCGLDEDSRHSPVFVAMKDVIEDESKRWELISKCDININWSAGVSQFRGQPRAYFCEIAMAQSVLHQHEEDYPDTGLPIWSEILNKPIEWFRLSMISFRDQVKKHCHECSVPLHGYGELSQKEDGIEQTSKTHKDIYLPKKKSRQVQIVTQLEQLDTSKINQLTRYLQNSKV